MIERLFFSLSTKAEFKKEKSLDPKSLAGIWVPEGDISEHYRFEIRINRGRLEARVLPMRGWRKSEALFPHLFMPDGEFVPAEWDGKNLRILDATAYSCANSVSHDNCPCHHSYLLQKISDNELKGEVRVKGHYYMSASGRRWVDDYSCKKVWIRKSK